MFPSQYFKRCFKGSDVDKQVSFEEPQEEPDNYPDKNDLLASFGSFTESESFKSTENILSDESNGMYFLA